MRVVHQSGKSGKVHATAQQWGAMLDHHAEVADVIELTEGSSPSARAGIEHWLHAHPEWNGVYPRGYGLNECAILSREPLLRPRSHRLTRLRLHGARKAPIYDLSARTFGTRFHVWHSPAHNGGLAPGWPTRVYLSAMSTYRDLLTGAAGRVVSADWNLDLRRADVRHALELPGLTWAVGPHQAPTLDRRVVDGIQTNLPIRRRSTTLDAVDGFDHRAVLTVLDEGK